MFRIIDGVKIVIILEEHKVFSKPFKLFIEEGLARGYKGGVFKDTNYNIVGRWVINDLWFEKFFLSNFE